MKTPTAVFLFCLTLAALACSQEIDVDLLQVRAGRVYFSAGTEAGAAAGASFEIVCGDSTVADGILEYAGPFVSFSRPLLHLDTNRVTTACRGRVTITGIDSTAVIRLGTELPTALIDPEHETLLERRGDSVVSRLADSVRIDGPYLKIYLPANVRFAGGGQLDAATLVWWLNDLRQRNGSYVTRFFFSRLLPSDSGGIESEGNLTVRLAFRYPLSMATRFLAHRDFAVYDIRGRGTGPLVLLESQSDGKKTYIPNAGFRGGKSRFSKLVIVPYDLPPRMREDFGQKRLDGYVGFGFDDDGGQSGRATAGYPFMVAMIPRVGKSAGGVKDFAAALYAAFDSDLAHLYFPSGTTIPANRWYTGADSTDTARLIAYDTARARALNSVLTTPAAPLHLAYDDRHLAEAAGFLADIAGTMNIPVEVHRYATDARPDIRLTFVPAADEGFPFGLLEAVMTLNDQNAFLPAEERGENPAWRETDAACRSEAAGERDNAFVRVQRLLVGTYGVVPLFRPGIEAVVDPSIKNVRFDDAGYPILDKIFKLRKPH